jgi:hypothetical protein
LKLCAVKLCIVHLCNSAFGVVDIFIHDVCGAAVDVEGRVHGHSEVFNGAVFAEDLADMVFFDVPG